MLSVKTIISQKKENHIYKINLICKMRVFFYLHIINDYL